MPLEIQTKRIEPDIVVLEFTGRIMMGEESQAVEKLVDDQLRQDERKIIIDLSGVDYIDSTGLGVIAHCFSAATRARGRLVVAGASGQVRHGLRTTKLDDILP